VWDGKPGDGTGGTADTIKWWQSMGYNVDIIDLEEIKSRFYTKSAFKPTFTSTEKVLPTASEEDLTKVNIMAILFADVVSYSKLNEKIIPYFVKDFLGRIAKLLDESPYAPIIKNTWGDALYFVFSDVYTAGRLALDIADFITQTPWEQKGLPDTLSIRISLHAGPVYKIIDPITMQISYTGTHVSRAARIEPITPPGMIYASEQFAALAVAEQVKEFTCNYVGKIEFSKGFGMFPVYHVRRTGGR
jgi:class 3 adenylate cyclase